MATRIIDLMFPESFTPYISSPFGSRVHPVSGDTHNHNGMDIINEKGDTEGIAIYCPADGKISKAGFGEANGNFVAISFPTSGYRFIFCHMSEYPNWVAGDVIHQGDTVGYIGKTGNVTGPHLHLEIRLNGALIDPKTVLL